jgi:hypothetical protein
MHIDGYEIGDEGKKLERRQRRGASGAPVVEKRTERGQGALLGLVGLSIERMDSPETSCPYHPAAVTIDHFRA